jgi:hypothetical protein
MHHGSAFSRTDVWVGDFPGCWDYRNPTSSPSQEQDELLNILQRYVVTGFDPDWRKHRLPASTVALLSTCPRVDRYCWRGGGLSPFASIAVAACTSTVPGPCWARVSARWLDYRAAVAWASPFQGQAHDVCGTGCPFVCVTRHRDILAGLLTESRFNARVRFIEDLEWDFWNVFDRQHCGACSVVVSP